MRRALVTLSTCLLAAACGGNSSTSSDGGTAPDADGGVHLTDGGVATSTSGVECAYSHDAFNSTASVNANSEVQWSCTDSLRTVTGNGLPDHPTGTFPNSNCPNTISAQNVDASMTMTPKNTGTATTLGIGPVGYALNGVVFDPGTAGTCSVNGSTTSCSLIGDTGSWNIEALGQTSFNFGVDDNNAHTQPTGTYHYHGIPTGILDNLNKGMEPTLVGWSLDGFPVYARYGYSSPMDATSSVVVLKGSYQLKTTPDSGRPSTSTYPLGTFSQDYEYAAGSGDLDECNGRVDVTPEFPTGIYHYYITDTYPYIGRCVYGTATTNTAPGDAGDSGATCGTCGSGEVCCPSGYGCAGMCVPNCNQSGCNSGMTCDTSVGVCAP